MKTVRLPNIHSLTDFKRRSNEMLEALERSGDVLVLTVNGKARLVVQDAQTYQRMLDAIESTAAVDGIKRGLEDVKHGRTRPMRQYAADFRKRHRLPKGK